MADGLTVEQSYRRAYEDEACKNAELLERMLRMEREVKNLRVKHKDERERRENLEKQLENEKSQAKKQSEEADATKERLEAEKKTLEAKLDDQRVGFEN